MNAPPLLYKSQSLEDTFLTLTPPKTPEIDSKPIHSWPEPETVPEEVLQQYLSGFETGQTRPCTIDNTFNIKLQDVLLLHGAKQRYMHTREQPVPNLENDREMLVAVHAIGLNPIDWKAPDFGWGLPALPCISGRDLAGKIVTVGKRASRFRVGDTVIAISTDYRDNRKAAFQQYSVVSDFNTCKIPNNVTAIEVAPLGVAFTAAALALGICLGVDFVSTNGRPRGPDLLHAVNSVPRESLSEDIRAECFDGIREEERPKSGDWIAIWGGSSATGCCAIQLAKLAGLKVIAIIDSARSGERMLKYGADLLVDRLDTERAISIVRAVTKGKLRFALDTYGRESAKLLLRAMQGKDSENEERSHLVGLTGLPKEPKDGIVYHLVPIKSFHEAPPVGEGLMIWLEQLLEQRAFLVLDSEVAPGGLEGINVALDRLRDGSVSSRIVVPLRGVVNART